MIIPISIYCQTGFHGACNVHLAGWRCGCSCHAEQRRRQERERAIGELVAACRSLLARFDAAPDGPLGCGLVAGDFGRLREAVEAAEGSQK